jgi:hypothetical protein
VGSSPTDRDPLVLMAFCNREAVLDLLTGRRMRMVWFMPISLLNTELKCYRQHKYLRKGKEGPLEMGR